MLCLWNDSLMEGDKISNGARISQPLWQIDNVSNNLSADYELAQSTVYESSCDADAALSREEPAVFTQ
jgi:hypothetical protein